MGIDHNPLNTTRAMRRTYDRTRPSSPLLPVTRCVDRTPLRTQGTDFRLVRTKGHRGKPPYMAACKVLALLKW